MTTNPTTGTSRPEDVPGAFEAAWNAHDMAALGALFNEDATFVNRFGHYVRGVNEIVALHVPIHETIYRDATLDNELIDVTQIADGAAVIHFWSRLAAGAAHPAGPHEVDTLIMAVLTRQNEIWRIQALENVTLTNPRTGEAILRGLGSVVEEVHEDPYRRRDACAHRQTVVHGEEKPMSEFTKVRFVLAALDLANLG
jgi:uncharacterized protein (TIGR02246 family)